MSDSVRPHRWQPIQLHRPWDSPGKKTGACCHYLLQCIKVKSESEITQSCPTLSDPLDCSLPGSSTRGIFQARVLEWVAIAFSVFGARGYQTELFSACISLFIFKRSKKGSVGNSTLHQGAAEPQGGNSVFWGSPKHSAGTRRSR